MISRAIVSASYSDGCFCKRRALKAEVYTPFEPVFRFNAAARAVAAYERICGFVQNKGKSAYGYIDEPCAHRQRQNVRIAWELAH